ncbi:hypothetical protein [Sphingomonas mesophila]|uniref:hypothetical protein n=1 Tax=Sphingomonas mesophila TaxID=2303576 RepID=UPI000E58DBD8|nr:hypothetical protein [Sphingomonas mesophila]
MVRPEAQSLAWRAFAVVVGLLGAAHAGSMLSGAGFDLATIRVLYWSLAPVGLAGYAFGFRWLPPSFWRAYALLFTIEITIRLAAVAWKPLAPLFGLSGESRHSTATVLIALTLVAVTCVALLRHGGWLKTPVRPVMPGKPAWKVAIAAFLKRCRNAEPRVSSYSLFVCGFAALAGAAAVLVVMRLWLSNWAFGLASIGFPFALLAFALGGRWLAENLRSKGKATILRGAAIGALVGTLVSWLVIFFILAMVAGPLATSREGLAALFGIGLFVTPIGVVYGTATGAALILLGRRMPLPES